MISSAPIESFGDLVERFPGIDQLDPQALGRFAFHAAVHMPSDDFRYSNPDVNYQDWHSDIDGLLSDVQHWRNQGPNKTISRLEMAKDIVNQKLKQDEVNQLCDDLQTLSAEEGYQRVTDLMWRDGYRLRRFMSPSPLYPEGRDTFLPLACLHDEDTGRLYIPRDAEIEDPNGRSLDHRLFEYLRTEHRQKQATELVNATLENLGQIDSQELERLRVVYGSKAASLMVFESKTKELAEVAEVSIAIPPFTIVSVDMYQAWLSGSDAFNELCETTRQNALGLIKLDGKNGGLVAVRSSAVKSEDGDQHSGAGVYKSVAVDPTDAQAFRKAIEDVYTSTRSKAALTYQEGAGIADEQMGLVIQQYYEEALSGRSLRHEVFFGHANSSGANPNLVEVTIGEGTLIYDKPHLQAGLLLEGSSEFLHTHPDHNSKLYPAIARTADIAHAVVLAERLFGKPMQVEFVNEAVVQVRPLIISTPETPVTFPEDLQAISECAASGFGDMELKILDEQADNSEKKGFVLFWHELEFTVGRRHKGYKSFPKEGVVIVMEPSSSGHIQAICREKGLMCFYPKKGSSIDELEDIIFESNGNFLGQPKDISLRFVADGYDGKVYQIEEA